MPASSELSPILARLQDPAASLPAADLYHLSDLNRDDLEALELVWPQVAVERRRAVMQDLGEIAEANLEVQFEAVFRLAIDDEDAEVRAVAIGSLWESENPALIAPFLERLQHDPAPDVRAAAASALGRFVYLGEVETIPTRPARRVEDALLAVVGGSDVLEVRRRALEAVAFSSRPEIPELITRAHAAPEKLWRISAVFAMGRSADPRWAADVLAELESPDPELRFEATRAAGELELPEAVPALKRLAEEGDVQVRESAIWSLGQIGGEDARAILLDLAQEADDDERDFIDDALENLQFHDEFMQFDLLAAAGDDSQDEDPLDDLGDILPPPGKRLN